jgi:hypothetical protein
LALFQDGSDHFRPTTGRSPVGQTFTFPLLNERQLMSAQPTSEPTDRLCYGRSKSEMRCRLEMDSVYGAHLNH